MIPFDLIRFSVFGLSLNIQVLSISGGADFVKRRDWHSSIVSLAEVTRS